MLTELVVRNLGVIDETSLMLGPGMIVVTGETGAGKTLIVGAIDLLTGGRADASLVRPGAAEAEIQGRFVIGDTETVVRRVIPRDGRSRVYIDRQLATVAALSELGTNLIDLHGQHAHQSLLKAPVQRGALDQFGRVDTSRVEALTDDLRSIEMALSEMGGDGRVRSREIDLLRYQIDEISAGSISDPDEDSRLDQEETDLADAAAHLSAVAAVAELLGSDGAVGDGMATVVAKLDGRGPVADLLERAHSVAAEMADLAELARQRLDQIEEDPERLDEIRERRARLKDLRRKYGDSLAEVMDYADQTRERLAELTSHDERAAQLEARSDSVMVELAEAKAEVKSARLAAAPKLSTAVESHLEGLAMRDAKLEISVDGEAGESVVFLLSANAGHKPQPLAKVASGGELARAMLALRLVLSAGPPTLVFDEVDAGIGGDAANRVGASLAELTSDHQVMVVTHLAQVAAFADSHVVISKLTIDGSTVSEARVLPTEERVIELSRMLSGSPESSAARGHAEELLEAGRAAKSR